MAAPCLYSTADILQRPTAPGPFLRSGDATRRGDAIRRDATRRNDVTWRGDPMLQYDAMHPLNISPGYAVSTRTLSKTRTNQTRLFKPVVLVSVFVSWKYENNATHNYISKVHVFARFLSTHKLRDRCDMCILVKLESCLSNFVLCNEQLQQTSLFQVDFLPGNLIFRSFLRFGFWG